MPRKKNDTKKEDEKEIKKASAKKAPKHAPKKVGEKKTEKKAQKKSNKKTQEKESVSNLKEKMQGPRIRIKVSAYDHKMIDSATEQILSKVETTGAEIIGPIPLPTKKKIFTVNKSTFVHKDSRDQFYLKMHRRLIDILTPSQDTVDNLMNLNLPSGVDVEIKM